MFAGFFEQLAVAVIILSLFIVAKSYFGKKISAFVNKKLKKK